MMRALNKNALRKTQSGRDEGFSLVELMIVVAIALAIAGMAAPNFITTVRNYRVSGDARNINGAILTAKMRAASNFTMARVYADTSAKSFRLEIWNKSGNGSWAAEGGTQKLSSGVSFPTSFGGMTPPADTQATIGQALPCKPGATNNPVGGTNINYTACIMFNSRGIPVDNNRAPTANDALYITDTYAVYGVTISATGLSRIWSSPAGTVSWQRR